MRREDLPDLMALSAVVGERSFRRAAATLGVSPSALSHAMRRLEDRLGIALLHRTTRSVAPTDAGLRLLEAIEPAFDTIDAGLAELASAGGRVAGRVRINLHRTAARLLVLPRLAELRRDHPALTVELTLDDGLSDIVAAGCDAGIRTGERLANDMVAVRISDDYRTAVVASPAYLAEHPAPTNPQDLGDHVCIGHRFVTSRGLSPWRFMRDGRALDVAIEPNLIVDDVDMARRAALDGLGLCYTLREAAAAPLASGALVEVMTDWSCPIAGDFLYYPSRRTLSPAMRVLVERLRHRGN